MIKQIINPKNYNQVRLLNNSTTTTKFKNIRFCSTTNTNSNNDINNNGFNSEDQNSNNNNDQNNNNEKKSKFFKYSVLGGLTGLGLVATSSLLLDEKVNDNHVISQLEIPRDPKSKKERVIILGTGWSSLAFTQGIDLDKYEIIVISPRNYFLFTPLLTSSAVGSVEVRSIIEPIRRVLFRLTKAHTTYIEAKCTEIDHENNQIVIKSNDGIVAKLPYDQLVIGVGSEPSSFGTKGVEENTIFLKHAMDAHKIRQKIMDCFENASIQKMVPGTTEEDLKNLLHFVLVGGGPTAVEASGSLHDYIKEDLSKMFPHIAQYSKITLIQSADHLLNTYDLKISEYTEGQFQRSGIEVLTNTRAVEVKKDRIVIMKKAHQRPPGEPLKETENPKKGPEVSVPVEIPFGMCVWSTGVGPNDLVRSFCNSIETQKNSRAITTDHQLQVIGIKNKNVYAVGDCSTISQSLLMAKINDLFKEADTNGDNKLSFDEIKVLFSKHSKDYPQLRPYSDGFIEFFNEFDFNKDGFLSLNEFKGLMCKVDSNLTTLPSTAQCANQMGKYLADSFNEKHGKGKDHTVEPFHYKHLGNFAYIGKSNAIADIPDLIKGGGIGVYIMWKFVYLEKQFSFRNKFLVFTDWIKTGLFGRDISRI
ncbi:hypothetical protein DICPUDRAFT_78261 [Dictyostelium purpureum]|uniref:EF-hand domain-containing protein n=1 Tax=Dictyostelium purpureum TaxID=5786 RepID=F0ZJ16_DICPU|nr:uncharacterized protein DICPUDRAFT_78261 [Dictyostelium purpureum]EGC36034.1 hypothetical protein DICPUDRAFT_78261 [Dictyostelium purpureum]|eukprot:XP_003287409.1 hypothetical protein DICPUDRAFT_78261 [Dictyostelium purpureum]